MAHEVNKPKASLKSPKEIRSSEIGKIFNLIILGYLIDSATNEQMY